MHNALVETVRGCVGHRISSDITFAGEAESTEPDRIESLSRRRANPHYTGRGQMRHVFVYGTLRTGEINDIGLAAARHGIEAPRWVGRAAVAGRLYDFGEYPGLVRDEQAGPVRGDVYEIDQALVPVLDAIEGVQPGIDSLFKSREIDVAVAGRELRCFYYPVDEVSVGGRPRIEAGDWISYRLARDSVGMLKYGR